MRSLIKSGSVRPPAIAGSFYAASRISLSNDIEHLLQNANEELDSETLENYSSKREINACILPHAGLIYSGAAAAKGYALLHKQSHRFDHVLLIGPSHKVYFEGLALASFENYQTPLGKMPVSWEFASQVAELPFVHFNNDAHAYEHCLEIHLPFIQTVLSSVKITPVVFGQSDAGQVSRVIELGLGFDNTLIIVSSDLSHFHDYQSAQQIDQKTSHQIESFDTNLITPHQACGSTAVNGLIEVARNHDWSVENIALCNSGDYAGDKNRVVGYGSYVFF